MEWIKAWIKERKKGKKSCYTVPLTRFALTRWLCFIAYWQMQSQIGEIAIGMNNEGNIK